MHLKSSLTTKIIMLSFVLIINFLFLVISYLDIGFPIGNYLFNQKGVLDDLEIGIILSSIFYDPQILSIPGFAWVTSPLTNFLNLQINNLIIAFSSERVICSVWEFQTSCSLATFFKLSQDPFIIPDLIIAIWIIIVPIIYIIVMRQLSKDWYLSLLLAFSYPIFYALSRGNSDMLITIFLGTFLIFLRYRKFAICFMLISVMAAIKLPMLILIFPLFIYYPRVKLLVASILSTVALYAIPVLTFSANGNFFSQIQTFLTLIERYNDSYAIGNAGLMHSTSLLSLAKTGVLFFEQDLSFAFTIYALLLIAIVFWLIFTVVTPILKKFKNISQLGYQEILPLFLLTIVLLILLPGVSQDYRLTLLTPFIAVIDLAKDHYSKWTISILVTVLISKNFLHLTFRDDDWGTTIGAIINPLLLIALSLFQATKFRNVAESIRR